MPHADRLFGVEPTVLAAMAKEGGLYNLGWYLAWTPGDKNATLDGDFTADELRSIAAYMDFINHAYPV